MVSTRKSNSNGVPKFAATVVGFIVLMLWSSSAVFAQGFSASIVGTVKDTSGAALAGAMVTVKHTETGLTRAVQADVAGGFTIPSLPVGAYELTAEKMGFERQVRTGIVLAVAQEAVIDVTLQVGSVVQQITVTEAAPLINATTSSTSGLISEQQIKDLPLNGRSFDQLLTLNVGMANNSANTANNGSAWTAFSVAGKRPETNRFLINGVDYVGGNAGGSFITPSGASGQLLGVDAVREYNVLTNSYGAEYGKRAGGQISIVTTSGTNQLHGSVFEYVRNSVFDARNFFDITSSVPAFKRNQFGASLGGPLKKNKLFLFGNYEGFRERLSLTSNELVPGANARLGLLPNGQPCDATGCVKPGMVAYANAFWPAPTGPDLSDGSARSVSNPVQSSTEDFGLGRFDYNISSSDTLSMTELYDAGIKAVPQRDPVFNATSLIRGEVASVQETHIFSPSVVNVATLGYVRNYAQQVTRPSSAYPAIPANLVFLSGGDPGSIIIGGGLVTNGPSNLSPASGNNPISSVRNYYTLADDLHFTRGKHAWSMGAWFQSVRPNLQGNGQANAGNVGYGTVTDFLKDNPSGALVVRVAAPVGWRQLEAAWYVQDVIALRRNLSLSLGLRHELTSGFTEGWGRCANYWFDPGFVIRTTPQGFDEFGKGQSFSCLDKNYSKRLFQPRLGLAWDPTGKGVWSVRAGFGIHNDLMDNLGPRAYDNPPFNARESLGPLLGNGFLPLIPLSSTGNFIPSCSAKLTLKPPACANYQPAGFDPNMRTPTIQEWSLGVQRQIVRDLMVEVSYVGSQSYHTNVLMNANQAQPQICSNAAGCLSGGVDQSSGGAACGPTRTNIKGLPATCPTVPQGTTYMVPGTRPNPFVAYTGTWFGVGTASYHSLNASLQKRATRGLSFKLNYTYSKVLDYNSAILGVAAGNEPANAVAGPYNLGLNRGPASYSLLHQFNGNFSYQLPFGRGQHFASGAHGAMNQVIGGWQWNGIVTAQGGFPITPQVGYNVAGTGDNSIDVVNLNPNFSGSPILGTDAFKKSGRYFDPNAFSIPVAGTFGNAGRGSFRGPGLVSADMSFFKKFQISEQWNLQFRAEIFNLLNRPNFAFPNPVVFVNNSATKACAVGANQAACSGGLIASSAGVLRYTSTTSRQIQFALKLSF